MTMSNRTARQIAQTEVKRALWILQTELGVMIDNSTSPEIQVPLLAMKVALVKSFSAICGESI